MAGGNISGYVTMEYRLKMERIIFVGFKGKNNASGRLAELISHEHLLLTNSFGRIKKEISSINDDYEYAVLFGVDKELTSTVRIEESAAKDDKRVYSELNLVEFAEALKADGIEAEISDDPQNSLCNEAYWHALTRFAGNAVFIHIPTIKYADEVFLDKMKSVFGFTDYSR